MLEAARPGAGQPERLVPRHARLGARDDPRRPRDAGHDRRRLPVDPAGARAGVARRAAGPPQRPPAGRARLRRVHGRPGRLPAEARRLRPLPAPHHPADPGAADRRRRPLHRPPELRGVLPVDGLAGRRVRELRRQRQLRAAPGRRRLRGPDTAGRPGRRDARELRPRRRSARGPPRARSRPTTRAPSAISSRCRTCPTLRSGAAREAADQEARARVRGDPVAARRVARDRGLHPVEPALLPARVGAPGRDRLLHRGGRAPERPGHRARPGADREHRGRQDRRGAAP